MKLLIHTCCAPCALTAITRLASEYQITLFFYNPNIHPEEEYKKRLKEVNRCKEIFGIEVIEGEYNPDKWFEEVKGLEKEPEGGTRCSICFKDRLNKTAEIAVSYKYDAFTTTLTVSPHKKAEVINSIGEDIGKKNNIKFLSLDLKKKDGFKTSVELSKKYNIYRQSYCGCLFSIRYKK